MKLLPLFVLIGAGLGLLIGFYDPDLAGQIEPVGTVYVRLMEVIVLPYLMSSLVLGLGSLSRETALRLFRKSWLTYLSLWGVCFGLLLTVALTVPRIVRPVVINYSDDLQTDQTNQLTLVDLLVPNNLFEALTNNYIPSIVLIGIIFGVAVQGINQRTEFLATLTVIRTACIRIWQWIVYLAPIGILALVAGSVNGMSSDGFAAMSIYVVMVCLSALLLTFWVLPMLLTSFLPVRYWELLSALRPALLIGIITSLSVAALPLVQQAARKLATKKLGEEDDDQRKEIIQTSLSVSYPLAQVGNFFILVFLLYASFYFFAPIGNAQLLELPFVTLLSSIGSPTSSIGAVTFMAEWLNMPAATTSLYIETMTVTRYAQVLASVSAFAFVTFLVTFNFYGKIVFHPGRFMLTIAVTVVALSVIWTAGRLGGSHIQLHSETNYMTMSLPEFVQQRSGSNSAINVQSDTSKPDTIDAGSRGTALQRIQAGGELRVGFNPHVMPFVYENDLKRYVGFDVEMMYRFAEALNVNLTFSPFTWQQLEKDLGENHFDIAIGGLYVTDERLQSLTVSDPYYDSPIALIVRESRTAEFVSRQTIDRMQDLTIAVFDDPIMIALAKRLFPKAKIETLSDYDTLEMQESVDAAIWTLEQARAWAISRDGYTAVVPEGLSSGFLFAYLMSPESLALKEYFNFWLREQHQNGVLQDLKRRWISPADQDMTLPSQANFSNTATR